MVSGATRSRSGDTTSKRSKPACKPVRGTNTGLLTTAPVRKPFARRVGPDPETIAAVGNKTNARAMATRAGVPVVPGSDGPVESEEEALQVAQEIGYPVIIKAALGGGGRGMRVASNDPSLINGYHAAIKENSNNEIVP